MNIRDADKNTYIDRSQGHNTRFQMISSQRSLQPWTSFWRRKDTVNGRLLTAAADGNKEEVQRLLNPLSHVDEIAEVRHTNKLGYGAVHLAVINDRLEILKVLLETDKTLLCMETENEDAQMIIHLAVVRNNLTIIRFLLGNPAYFRLSSEPMNAVSKSGSVKPKLEAEAGAEELLEENILSVKDGLGNTAVHLMFKHSQAATVRFVFQTAYKQYMVPVKTFLELENKAGRKPMDMSCEIGFKNEVRDFVSRLIERGPPSGNSLSVSQRRISRFRQSNSTSASKRQRKHTPSIAEMPGYQEASKRCLDGVEFEQFVERLNHEYETRKFTPNYGTQIGRNTRHNTKSPPED